MRSYALGLLLLALASGAWAGSPDGASLNAFQGQLLAGSSATATLARWCGAHHLADPPRILALRRADVQKAPGPEVRRRLRAEPDEAIIYRRVDLVCGDRLLSEADNWYRPALLTPEMNRRLNTTQTPFGQVVAAMNFHRQVLGLSRPRARAGAASPPVILRLRALLISGAGAPFALVEENYTPAILGH